MPERDRIAAIALLTAGELTRLGLGFDRAWPVEQAPCFDDLLRAIDEADTRLQDPAAPPVEIVERPT